MAAFSAWLYMWKPSKRPEEGGKAMQKGSGRLAKILLPEWLEKIFLSKEDITTKNNNADGSQVAETRPPHNDPHQVTECDTEAAQGQVPAPDQTPAPEAAQGQTPAQTMAVTMHGSKGGPRRRSWIRTLLRGNHATDQGVEDNPV